jgi:hypothetical protein
MKEFIFLILCIIASILIFDQSNSNGGNGNEGGGNVHIQN